MYTLLNFLRSRYAPMFWFGRLKLNTISEYVTSVKYYVSVLGDLQLDQINAAKNSHFLNELSKRKLKIPTVQKHCRHLNTIFLKMGPTSDRNRDAFGLLDRAPWIRPPKAYFPAPKEVEDSIVDRLYHATNAFPACYEYPLHLDESLRPQFWKALIALATTTALRKGVLFGLQWGDVSLDFSRVSIPCTLDKCRRERRRPLHPVVYRLLESIRSNEKLLYWPHGNKKFYDVWHGLNDFCEIPAEEHVMPHDLKRYALQLACRSGVDAATLQTLGDHSSLKTTLNHYAQGNLEGYVEKARLPGSAPIGAEGKEVTQ